MFRVSSFGIRVAGFGFQVSGFGYRVSGIGYRVSGIEFRVSGFVSRIQVTNLCDGVARGEEALEHLGHIALLLRKLTDFYHGHSMST